MALLDINKLNALQINGAMLNYLPPLVAAAFVVGIAHTTATMTWSILPSAPEEKLPVSTSSQIASSNTSTSRSANTNSGAITQISQFHLFGIVQKEVPKPVVAPQPVVKEAPDTSLRLTLKGVVASKDMMDAWAIIADRMGKEDNYTIESELPGGATLKEIYVDRVILLHNGRLEMLRLPKSELKQNNASSSRSSANSRRSTRRTSTSRSTRRNNTVNSVSSEASQALRGYRDKLLNDPQSVMNTVRAEPYRNQAGKLEGYRIFPGRDKKLFSQLGLQPGDVVTSVNGVSLNSPLKGLEVMQKLSDATEVSVEVLRNGASQTYVVPMN